MPGPSIKEYNNVLALASDTGLCAQVLARLAPDLLRQAATRKDAWGFLLGVEGLPCDVRKFCRAASSALQGAFRLARMARGIATTRTDWAEEYRVAVQAGDAKKAGQLEGRLVRQTEAAYPGGLGSSAPPELRQQISEKIHIYQATLARRVGARKASASFPRNMTTAQMAARAAEVYPREWLLITGWLRLPNGDPGLCFFSKPALASLFHHLGFALSPKADPSEDSRSRLRRLGLVQGPVLVRGVRKRDDGVIMLTPTNGVERPLRTAVRTGANLRYQGLPQQSV